MSNIFDKIMTSDLGSKLKVSTVTDSSYTGKSDDSKEYTPKSKKRSDILIEKIAKRGFNVEQMETIFRTGGNQLILSGAGSGKTTSLIFLLLFDQTTGEVTSTREINGNTVRVMDNILVSTFLKTGAEELHNRYKNWANLLGVPDMSEYIKFSTLHSEFKAALTQMGVATSIINDSENRKLMKKAYEEVMRYSSNRLNSEDYQELETALTRTRNTLNPATRYENDFYVDKSINPMDVDSILGVWRESRKRLGKVDFEDLQEILYNLLYVQKDKVALDVISQRFNYLYIDEFQDTSEIQYAILKKYMESSSKTIAIGDDDQTIYSWRGSSSDIITKKFQEDFDVTYNELNINYRCPSVILGAIVPSIERNENRFHKDLKSSRDGGELKVGYFDSASSMGDALINLINEDIRLKRKVTILGRTNVDLFLPALLLSNGGNIDFSLSNSKMTFDNHIGRVATSLPALLNKKHGTKVSTALKSLVWEKREVDALMKVCKTDNVFFSELDPDDLRYSFPSLYPHLLAIGNIAGSSDELTALKDLYQYFIDDARRGSGEYSRNLAGVLSAIYTWLNASNHNNLREAVYDLDDMAVELKYKVGEDKRKNQVRLATVHEYKGKEATSVYIWNDSEGVFPYHKGMDDPEVLEEERRIHYIAATRASESLTILVQRGNKSRFLSEMDLGDAIDVSPQNRKIKL